MTTSRKMVCPWPSTGASDAAVHRLPKPRAGRLPPGSAGRYQQSLLNPGRRPLFLLDEIPVFAKGLNPVFEVEGRSVVMVTQGMAAAPVQMLKQPVISLDERRAEIVAALDL